MNLRTGSEMIRSWPEDAREPAQLVIDSTASLMKR